MSAILVSTEKACAVIAAMAIANAALQASVYTGLDSDDKNAPAVICSAESATEDFPASGLWHVRAIITTKEIAADTVTPSVLSDVIQEAFLSDDTINNLNNAIPQFFVFDVLTPEVSNTQEVDAWVQTLSLEIVCSLTE